MYMHMREGGTHYFLLSCSDYLYLHLQECYSLLQKHQIAVSQEDLERVDTLQYMWANLTQQVAEIQSTLLKIQPRFKSSLLTDVEEYQEEVGGFVADYSTVS